MQKRQGLHLRMQDSIVQLAEKAEQLAIPFFQCFFVLQETGKLVVITQEQKTLFLKMRNAYFDTLFCHGSYWINLASLGNNGYRSLCKEVSLAKQLEFTHFLLHPGTAKGAKDKSQGIDALAFCLNNIIKKERDITFLLENTCHDKLAVGSDIADFRALLEKIDKPERIGFCIDTAHAYSFGYNIVDPQLQDDFITFLDKTIGTERIQLIHLNDSAERFGSKMDRHAVFGKGKIGKDALMRFAMHEKLRNIPLILELPEIEVKEEKNIIDDLCL